MSTHVESIQFHREHVPRRYAIIGRPVTQWLVLQQQRQAQEQSQEPASLEPHPFSDESDLQLVRGNE